MSARDQIRIDAVNSLSTLSDSELIVMGDAITEYVFLLNDDGNNTLPGDWQPAPGVPLSCRMLDSQAAFSDAVRDITAMDPRDGRQSIRDDAARTLSLLDSEERDTSIRAIIRRAGVSDSLTGESLSASWVEGYANVHLVYETGPLAIRDVHLSLMSLP